MLDTIPLQLQDGWSVAGPDEANMDARALLELTQWIEQTYKYQNTHAVLIEHAGHLIYELYLEGEDDRWEEPLGERVFDVDSLHDLRCISKSVTSLVLGLALGGDYEEALATPGDRVLSRSRHHFWRWRIENTSSHDEIEGLDQVDARQKMRMDAVFLQRRSCYLLSAIYWHRSMNITYQLAGDISAVLLRIEV